MQVGERNHADFGKMHTPHPDGARFIHSKTNLAWCRENSPQASSITGPSSCTSYHITTTLLNLRHDAGITDDFALGEGSYHLGSLPSSGNGCLPKKLTMLSSKYALLLYHHYYYYYHSYCFLFNINRKDNTDFMYVTVIPRVLGNNHKNNFSIIINSLPKLKEEQTERNDNNELGTRAI